MAPVITPVRSSIELPDTSNVIIIGAGIVGLSAALTLAERGISVLVLEKGRIAGMWVTVRQALCISLVPRQKCISTSNG